MSRITSTEVIRPSSLSAEARNQLTNSLYAVHARLFESEEELEENDRLRERMWKTLAERRFDDVVRGLEGYGHLGRARRLSLLRSGEHRELRPQEWQKIEAGPPVRAVGRGGLRARGAREGEKVSDDLYSMKRPLPDGTTHLLFTGLELLRRVASRVPPPRANLTRFHGVFAPGAQLRPFLVPQAGAEEANEAPQAAASKEPLKERTPRVDWAEMLRRTFDFDVFACVRCGGRRRLLAYVKQAGGVRAILAHLGLPTAGALLAPREGHPRPRGVEAPAAPV